jgi:ParB/RepB/Spo0J family partition protein
MATAPNVQNLPIEQIDPSPDNPRLAFGGGLGDLTELTESIRAQGVLQHLVVCPQAEGRYQLVFGHRRLAAAQAAGLTEVPAEIRDYDATERFAAMYGENFGREGLTPLQEAWAYQQALNHKGPGGKKLFTQRSLAERLGVSQAKISKYTGIFKLPEHVVAMLTGGELTITEAIHLVLLAKDPARVEAALGDFRQHHDMELAVRTQQADIERQARVAKTLADLKKQRVRVAPDDWREQGGKRLGDGYYDLHQTPEEHAGQPCHAAMVTHHGDVAWVCTDPDRHRPPNPSPPGHRPQPMGPRSLRTPTCRTPARVGWPLAATSTSRRGLPPMRRRARLERVSRPWPSARHQPHPTPRNWPPRRGWSRPARQPRKSGGSASRRRRSGRPTSRRPTRPAPPPCAPCSPDGCPAPR